jgi:hypothetical protein
MQDLQYKYWYKYFLGLRKEKNKFFKKIAKKGKKIFEPISW